MGENGKQCCYSMGKESFNFTSFQSYKSSRDLLHYSNVDSEMVKMVNIMLWGFLYKNKQIKQ